MRTSILSFLALGMFFVSDASAQIIGCNELFITEYVEGTGNNKCLELFNPTSEAIDLSVYQVQRWGNGEAGMTDATQLFGTLAPLTTWVLVNGQTEDIDLGGGAISPACDPELQLLADQLDNPYPAPTYMNGDDAIVIVKNGSQVVDIFGKPGEDPGTAWTDDAENGYVDVGDGATWLTSNHTLRRKFEVGIGVTVPPVSFNTFLEWDTLEVNTWDGLGHHSCVCGSTGVEAINIIPQQANIFPNPSDNGQLTIESSAEVELLEVYSPEGKLVYTETPSEGVRKWNFNSTDWQAGIYFVNLKYTQGTIYAHRVVIR